MKFENNLLEHKVRIVDIDNQVFVGAVELITDKEDDPEGKNSISLRVGYKLIGINDDEIKSIEIIK